ncbi:MAG: cytochrome c oxidase subunit II [Acidimicrobiia bacterium]|nr:cytochrome c oxidase subunit II [Acidimicrobiia bacterium]
MLRHDRAAGRHRREWSPGRPARPAPVIAAVLATSVAASCGTSGFPDPATEQGSQTLDLWNLFTLLALLIGGLVYVLVAIIVIRYRRRGSDELPSQQQYSSRIEIFYTVLPLVIVVIMFAMTWRTSDDITAVSDDPAVVIDVIGFQWQWQFNYPEHDIRVMSDPAAFPEGRPKMVIPAGETVRLRLVSNDVIHSFWVPDFLEKRDLIPGIDNEIDVEADEVGTWEGRCAEFCGLEHWKMYFEVEAVPPDEFEQWVAGHEGEEVRP